MQADFEVRMNTKKNEISGLLNLHHSRIGTLCDFILERMPQVVGFHDPAARQVMGIVSEHQGQTGSTPNSDKLHVLRTQQVQELEARSTFLEGLARAQDDKLQQYSREVEALGDALDAHKRKEGRMVSEIGEKDAQIATLNNKISQLLAMRNIPGCASTPTRRRVEKDLPFPDYQERRRSRGSGELVALQSTDAEQGNVATGKSGEEVELLPSSHRADDC